MQQQTGGLQKVNRSPVSIWELTKIQFCLVVYLEKYCRAVSLGQVRWEIKDMR